MSKALGVPIVVENRAGAGGNIGAKRRAGGTRRLHDRHRCGQYARDQPDAVRFKLPFRVPQDFTAIGQILSQPNVLLVSLNVPAKTPRNSSPG